LYLADRVGSLVTISSGAKPIRGVSSAGVSLAGVSLVSLTAVMGVLSYDEQAR
jgi:hypothetical protein